MICWRLYHGEVMTARQAATLTGLSYDAAFSILNKLSRVVPLIKSGDVWLIQSEALPKMPRR